MLNNSGINVKCGSALNVFLLMTERFQDVAFMVTDANLSTLEFCVV